MTNEATAPPWALINGTSLSKRAQRLLLAYGLGTSVIEVARRAFNTTRTRLAYSVAVPATDDIYPLLHAWLLERLPRTRQRSLSVRSGRAESEIPAGSDVVSRAAPPLAYYYDGRSEQRIVLDGHRVRVAIERPQPEAWQQYLEANSRERLLRAEERIVFTAYGLAAHDAIRRLLETMNEERNRENRLPRFYLMTRWGEWSRRSSIRGRALDTVVLRDGQKEAVVADLERFLASEADYRRLGVPYHRGYLMHGPPGSGKTSLAEALATHFGLDLYFMPLSDLEKDTNLLQLVAHVQPRSLLLLEDIDVLHAARSREDTPFGVSLSGLLNALDGVGTPHGLVTMMTTNSVEGLDAALIRPGRVDYHDRIDWLTDSQIADLARVFFGRRVCDLPALGDRQVSAAQIVEIAKRNLGDPEMAVDELRRFLWDPDAERIRA